MFPVAVPFVISDQPQLGEPLLTVVGHALPPIDLLTTRVTQLEHQLQWHADCLREIQARLQTPWYRRTWDLLVGLVARWRPLWHS